MVDGYSTHQRLLVKYLMRTSGPIVEIGCGNYSTPIIHEIAAAQGRTVLTLDSDAAWLSKFAKYTTPWHTFQHVTSWDDWSPSGKFGLVFIDHTPGNRRPIEFIKLRDVSDVLILHDTEAGGYDWKTIYPFVDHIETDADVRPSTTVLRGTSPAVHFDTVPTPWHNHWTEGIRYLVVVPTFRLELAQKTIDILEESLTYPTEFHVLDGSKGKCHAINRALVELLRVEAHDIYCTVDDDLIMSPNWQHYIACALARVPKLGVCSIDYRGSQLGENLMRLALSVPIVPVADVSFRDCTGVQNVAGGCMAMPAKVAKQVGTYLHADDGRRYHLEEDSWRCHRATQMGYRIGYVSNPNGVVQMVEYELVPEYETKKQQDVANWLDNPSWNNR